MGRKLTRRGAIDKCHNIWSLCVRARDKKCVLCGREYGKMDAHHCIVPRGSAVGHHWFMLDNGAQLCFLCHGLVHSKRGDKVALEKWLALLDSRVSKERQAEIIRAKHTTAKFTMEDYEGIYENLLKQYNEIVKEKGE